MTQSLTVKAAFKTIPHDNIPVMVYGMQMFEKFNKSIQLSAVFIHPVYFKTSMQTMQDLHKNWQNHGKI